MKNNIVFDFDGTLARTTPYHRLGWELAIQELNINKDLDHVLSYVPNLTERFDSYNRIKTGFLGDMEIKSKVSAYFGEDRDALLAKKLVDLKESLTINAIFQENVAQTLNNLGVNLLSSLNALKSIGMSIGIISSTREPIICSFLHKCGILETFDFIIGEESLTSDNGTLFDKPNPYVKKVLDKMDQKMSHYIGDNEIIDKEFAEACEAEFIYADYKTNFLDILNKLS